MEINTDATLFAKTIHRRINAYFKETQQSIKANRHMKWKIATALIWFTASYFAMLFLSVNAWVFVGLYLFHGLSQIFFSYNVGHDALHYAVSEKRNVNRLWASTYDLLGVNTYMWRKMHHQGHHACLNVEGEDMSLVTAGFLRLSPEEPRRRFHRYQHIYAYLLYGLYVLYYVLFKDFKYFFSKNNIHLKGKKHSPREWARLLIGKATYLSYMILVPILVTPYHWGLVVGCFVLTLFYMGVVMSLTFQVSHIIDSTEYPLSNDQYENYVMHVFATTSDYLATNPVANWFFGGLNVHVIHHLRQDVCHTHYPALTKIVKQTAAEFGVPYRENKTLLSALRAHHRQLENLGKGGASPRQKDRVVKADFQTSV
jgi:linoleoyl-CoA desaturase